LPGFGKNPSEPQRPYEPIENQTQLLTAIEGMHILREIRDNPSLGGRKAAKECLSAATGNVTFLGFAYAQENLEALDLAKTRGAKVTYGTVFDVGEDERIAELRERLARFDVALSENWRFDVYTALLTRPRTILGPPR